MGLGGDLEAGRGAGHPNFAISPDNATERPRGRANDLQLLVARASMTGFVVFDRVHRSPEGVKALAGWPRSGELKVHEDVVYGDIADLPETLLKLFRGENAGTFVLALDGAR
jgi:hypothetical protein